MTTFAGKVAVVTGGASGIGRAIALELARRGASVAIADINETRLEATVAEVLGLGVDALGVRGDVTSDEAVDLFRDATINRFAHVDVLCNNAGVAVLGPPERVAMADWEWILQVNVLGLVRGVRAFVPAMVARGSGHVVNTASVAGTWAYTWDSSPYITSKFAAYGFSEALARTLRPQGIGVTVLCPGLVTTNLAETARQSGVPTDRSAEWFYLPPDMQTPVDPDYVGRLVADAIESNTFTVFTHAQDAARFRTWRLDIEKSLTDAIEGSPRPPRLD
jgi:NAD(P)-dependent dehydrogenase (short-subunit alcohol dehydrogenase family)